MTRSTDGLHASNPKIFTFAPLGSFLYQFRDHRQGMTSDENEETGESDEEEQTELADLDPNAEEAARKAERQLRRVRLESKR